MLNPNPDDALTLTLIVISISSYRRLQASLASRSSVAAGVCGKHIAW